MLIAIVIAERSRLRLMRLDSPAARATIFGLAWFIALIAPALPIVLRSEVRIYAPAIGLAIAGAAMTASLVRGARAPVAALAVAAIGLGTYQAARSVDEGRAARFSRALVVALAANRALAVYDGPIVLTAADDHTTRLLRDGVGGYGTLIVQRALRRDAPPAWPSPAVERRDVLTVRCLASGDTVTLTIGP